MTIRVVIVDDSPTTRLPRVPSYVAGAVNLRGTGLPVMDLAARLGWRATDAAIRLATLFRHLSASACRWSS